MPTQNFEQKLTAKFSVKAWAGDLSDLQKVVDVCAELANGATQKAAENILANRPRTEAYFRKTFPTWNEDLVQSQVDERQQSVSKGLTQHLGVTMSATERTWEREVSGVPSDVMSQVEPGEIKSISVTVGALYSSESSGGFGLSVDFTRDGGASVRAIAPTNEWLVLATKGALRDVLLRGRPWYWWTREIGFLFPAFAVSLSVSLILVVSTLPDMSSKERASLYAVTWLVPLFAALGLTAGVRRLIPAFELTSVGTSPRGKRIMLIAGSVVVWLVGTIAVPLFLQGAA